MPPTHPENKFDFHVFLGVAMRIWQWIEFFPTFVEKQTTVTAKFVDSKQKSKLTHFYHDFGPKLFG